MLVLYDKKIMIIVSNESSEILRMFGFEVCVIFELFFSCIMLMGWVLV